MAKQRLNSLSTDWLADSVEDKTPRLPFRALKIYKDSGRAAIKFATNVNFKGLAGQPLNSL